MKKLDFESLIQFNNREVINAGLNHCLDLKPKSMTVETFGKACKDMGCFQVINYGISYLVMKDAKEVALDFFETSTNERCIGIK